MDQDEIWLLPAEISRTCAKLAMSTDRNGVPTRVERMSRLLVSKRSCPGPDGHPHRTGQAGQVGQPGHMVQVEVRDDDVKMIRSSEKPGVPAHRGNPSASVEQ